MREVMTLFVDSELRDLNDNSILSSRELRIIFFFFDISSHLLKSHSKKAKKNLSERFSSVDFKFYFTCCKNQSLFKLASIVFASLLKKAIWMENKNLIELSTLEHPQITFNYSENLSFLFGLFNSLFKRYKIKNRTTILRGVCPQWRERQQQQQKIIQITISQRFEVVAWGLKDKFTNGHNSQRKCLEIKMFKYLISNLSIDIVCQ